MVKLTLDLSFEDAKRVLDLLTGQALENAGICAAPPIGVENAPAVPAVAKKRGRPSKAEPVRATAPVLTDVPGMPTASAAEPATEAKTEPAVEITGDMVRAALVKYSGSGHGIIGVRKLLQPLGYEKISEIQPKDYAKVIEATKA